MRKYLLTTMALAVLLVASPGCMKKLDLKAAPAINNPAVNVKSDPAKPLMAGYAKQAITPRGPALLAGFGPMRISTGVHDDLYVKTLVLKQGDEKLAMVAVDCIGIQRTDILAIKAMVQGYRPDQILIASTHTHSGKDTLGLWGLPPLFSGRSDRFIRKIGRAVADTIAKADRDAVPVTAYTSVFEMDPSIMVNLNEGEPEDHHMGLMVFRDQADKTVATLINAVGHPEAMWDDNHKITADWPGRVCELTEKKYGGGAIFFNGALGAMMSPARPGPGQKHDFPRMERISQAVFKDLERGMGMLVQEKDPAIAHRQSLVLFPAKNDEFELLMKVGILDRDMFEGEKIETEVNVIEIGSAQFVTFPGEDYPKQGLNIREHQKKNSFQIGLADDELGYILYPKDYGTEMYKYETSMCAGPELSTDMEAALMELLSE